MHVSRFLVLLTLFAFFTPAEAQQPKKIPRIGFLAGGFASASPERPQAFRQGLRELGYVDGKNIIVEYRYAEENAERLAEFAAELVRLNVDLIVSAGPPGTRAAKKATETIPIVHGARS